MFQHRIYCKPCTRSVLTVQVAVEDGSSSQQEVKSECPCTGEHFLAYNPKCFNESRKRTEYHLRAPSQNTLNEFQECHLILQQSQ